MLQNEPRYRDNMLRPEPPNGLPDTLTKLTPAVKAEKAEKTMLLQGEPKEVFASLFQEVHTDEDPEYSGVVQEPQEQER